MTTYHCELAWLGGAEAVADVLLRVEGDTIVDIATGGAAGAMALRGITLPGIANAHSHAFHRALRGRTQRGTGSFWTWRDRMYEVAARLDPTTYEELATAVFGEMALAGITCVGEFHYLHHRPDGSAYDDPNAMGAAIVRAAARAGLRLTLLDTCYLHGGLEDGAYRAVDDVQRRFCDGDAAAWGARASLLDALAAPTVRVGAAVHSARAVDPSAIRVVAEWAAQRAAPLHAHVSEQRAENYQCIAAHGRTPTVVLHHSGALGERFTAVHATHPSRDDIELLGATRSTVCFCPTTERDLADGIGPARSFLDAGAALSIGTDSHAVIDPFEEMRAVELDERLATGVRGQHDATALLQAGTSGGYACLGWPQGGRLEVGALADFVSVRLDTVRNAGTDRLDALAATVFAATASDVHHVVVGGEVVVRDGVHVRVDVVGLLARTIGSL